MNSLRGQNALTHWGSPESHWPRFRFVNSIYEVAKGFLHFFLLFVTKTRIYKYKEIDLLIISTFLQSDSKPGSPEKSKICSFLNQSQGQLCLGKQFGP